MCQGNVFRFSENNLNILKVIKYKNIVIKYKNIKRNGCKSIQIKY